MKQQERYYLLETLLGKLSKKGGIDYSQRANLIDFGAKYQKLMVDLAVTQAKFDKAWVTLPYINSLGGRAHSKLYSQKSSLLQALFSLCRDFCCFLRLAFANILTVFCTFIVISLFSFAVTFHNEDFAEFSYLDTQVFHKAREGNSLFRDTSIIIVNNISKLFRTYAFSLFPVVGTLFSIAPTSLHFGAINAIAIKQGRYTQLLFFIFSHLVFELMAVFVAAGGGFFVGLGLITPGDRTRRQLLLERGGASLKLLIGCIPVMILAGVIEGFISSSTSLGY